MQSQQRAEAGVKEKIIGYVGYDWEPEPDAVDMLELGYVGPASEVKVSELPQDIQDIFHAEMHRLRTGEVMTVETFKRRGGEKK